MDCGGECLSLFFETRLTPGNAAQTCGGSSRLTTFVNNNLPPVAALPDGWTAQGCYAEPSSGRALNKFYVGSSTMTTAKCIAACAAKGYTIAGTEYGAECYCASAFTGGAPAPALECQAMCGGAKNERCGGGRRLSIYTQNQDAQPAAAPAASSTSAFTSSSTSPAPAASSVAPSSASASASPAATNKARRATRRRSSRWGQRTDRE